MKWPKGRRNQATHVFTHTPNKQENKGRDVMNSAHTPEEEGPWDATRGSHQQAADPGRPAGQAEVQLSDALSKPAWICPFTCRQGGRFWFTG